MKVVLDTNVLVSGLLHPFKPPGEIVRMASEGVLNLCYDARILAEYREVLSRPSFQFEPSAVQALLDQIKADGILVAALPLSGHLPGIDDEIFLEAAISGGARCLVTGNIKHFPLAKRQGMEIWLPAEFLEFYSSQGHGF